MKNYKKIGGFKTPLFKTLSTDESREKLNYAFVKDGFVYASNGVILIKSSLSEIHEIDEEQQKFIEGKSFHIDLLKQLWKFKIVDFQEDCITAMDGRSYAEFSYSTQIESPDFETVLKLSKSPNDLEKIGINPKQLELLSSAMDLTYGNGAVILQFSSENKGINVFSSFDSRDFQNGVIMPTLLTNS